MDETFKILVDGLSQKYNKLISMEPVSIDTSPSDTPKGGVYLFYENEIHIPKQAIIKECANIANRAMKLSDCVERRYKGQIESLKQPLIKKCAAIANAAMMTADYVQRRLTK